MSTDRPPGPLTPEEENLLKGMGKLLADEPMRHNCENCGTEALAPISRLPIGWRYLALGEGWETVDEVDNDTRCICSFCVARVEEAMADSKKCGSK